MPDRIARSLSATVLSLGIAASATADELPSETLRSLDPGLADYVFGAAPQQSRPPAAPQSMAPKPYIQGGLGCHLPTATSNADELEFNGDFLDCGLSGQVEGGYVTPITPRLDLELGIGAQGMIIDLHGQNAQGKQTADGESLHLAVGLAVARVSYEVVPDLLLHTGAGGGGALLLGLDDSELAPAVRLEAGARYAITDNLSAGLSYQALTTIGGALGGNDLDTWFHGPTATIRWQFD